MHRFPVLVSIGYVLVLVLVLLSGNVDEGSLLKLVLFPYRMPKTINNNYSSNILASFSCIYVSSSSRGFARRVCHNFDHVGSNHPL